MKLIGLTKTLLVVAVLAFVVVPTVAMAQNSVHCDDPNTGKKKWVKIWRIHAMYKDTSEILENEGIHILDLEEDDWKAETSRALGGEELVRRIRWNVCTGSVAGPITLDADFTISKFSESRSGCETVSSPPAKNAGREVSQTRSRCGGPR